jgi:hypothetical protein
MAAVWISPGNPGAENIETPSDIPLILAKREQESFSLIWVRESHHFPRITNS